MSATWKTVRVFISSTFKDMQAERDHLVRFVFPRLREELLGRRMHFVDVDLRWGVTSEQDAQPLAYFSMSLEHIITHPNGRLWAGSSGNHVYIITLEGDASGRRGPDRFAPAHGASAHLP